MSSGGVVESHGSISAWTDPVFVNPSSRVHAIAGHANPKFDAEAKVVRVCDVYDSGVGTGSLAEA